MESKRILFLFSFLAVILLSGEVSAAVLGGGYNPINDLTDPYLVGIGKFAVAMKNKHATASEKKLVFVKLVAGKKQVVSGTNYKLIIKAKVAGTNYGNNYEAVVYDKWSEKSWTLTSFKPLFKNA